MTNDISAAGSSRLAPVSFGAAFGVVCGPLAGAVLQTVPVLRPVGAGLILAGMLSPPSAIVLGILAMREIRRSGGALSGRGFAIAGIVLGIVEIAVAVLAVVAIVIAFRNFTF